MEGICCNICGKENQPLLSLENVSPVLHRLYGSRELATQVASVGVAFRFCTNCSHVSVIKDWPTVFDATSNNDQTASSVAVERLARIVDEFVEEVPALD